MEYEFLNPPVTVHEMHMFLTLWNKLLGFNHGLDIDHHSLLEEYQWRLEGGIDDGQLGRIGNVRDVGDAKPYGDEFQTDKGLLTYIRTGICSNSDDVQPYEDLLNDYSKELRRKIHVEGSNPKPIVSAQIRIAGQLDEAQNSMLTDPQQSVRIYNSLENLASNPRTLNMDNALFDNFALEHLIGSFVAASCLKDRSYRSSFYEKSAMNWNDFLDEDDEKGFDLTDMLYTVDFEGMVWSKGFADFLDILRSPDEANDPFSAAYLMHILAAERNEVYSPEAVSFLRDNL